ncbi:MAG TPA: zinc-ribbon domain containing protein [Chloroflexota bacterium]|jgi:CxxC-x17-CxxC domain-containing protein|nr:zinc-ribbon domain containing protein [Chloroflexota bacterium]
MFVDKTLVCRGCGREFVFTAGEQQFYQLKGLLNEPGRCPACRAARKAERATTGLEPMEPRRREMHPVICAECGVQTLVPFLPRGDRPVYCSPCFDRVRAMSR